MVSASLSQKAHCFLAAALLFFQFFLPAQGAEVVIPLTISFDLLTMRMVKLKSVPEDSKVMRYDSNCSHLYLDSPQFGRQDSFVRFIAHGTGSAGAEVFGWCLNPINWRGYIEILSTPSITADWRLHLQVDHSNLYDESWQKGVLMGPIWDIAQDFVLPSVTGFSVDLTPPRDDVLSLLRPFVPPAGAAKLDAIFRSAAVKGVKLDDSGVNVEMALLLPDSIRQPVISHGKPTAPLSPEELAVVQQALEQWDAFLVFVIKNIGEDIVDPDSRDQLFDLLIDTRYEILPILAGENAAVSGDPVRALFVETWDRLKEIIQNAEHRGVKLNNAVRYAAFLRAGDVLLTIDRAAPGLGLEISADGLRRLARIMQPELKVDPLKYGLEPDPSLRELFGLPVSLLDEESLEPIPEDANSILSLFGIIGNVYAAEPSRSGNLSDLKQQLNQWVPDDSEFNHYISLLSELLLQTADQELKEADIANRYEPVFRDLVRATALKESCWRHFVRKDKKITYLRSSAGSIGLMQINPYVWRGFYKLSQLKWNILYNAKAGAEILRLYMLRYAIKEEKTASIDNIARSTYAIYNAGPGAAGRYREKNSSQREKKVDNRFWNIYRGFKADGKVDLFNCVVIPD